MPIINQCFSKLCCGKPDERAVVDNQNAPRAQAVYQVANQHIQQASPVLAAAPQIPAPASTSASTSASAPAQNYLLDGSVPIHNLVTFADDPRFPQVDKILLAEELALRLHDPALTAKTRFDLCASLVKTLSPGMTVIYAERKRGDSFFANMAVDIFVANPGLEKCRITKNRFADLVSRWLNEIAPDRQSFSVQGAQISRDAMQQWLLETKAPKPAQDGKKKAALKNLAELQTLHRAGANSVHNERVIAAGEIMFADIRNQLNGADLPDTDSVCKEITRLAAERPDRTRVGNGLAHVLAHNPNTDSRSEVESSSILSLRMLWAYIQQHKDPQMSRDLMNSTFLRLAEIAVERTCFTGCTERILDIPTGIDPGVGVLSAFDFRQDVTTIAGQVQNRMDEAFEGTQLENVDNLEGVDQQVLSDIRVAMFRNAVSVEMGRLRGIPADQFENEVEKLSPGFTY